MAHTAAGASPDPRTQDASARGRAPLFVFLVVGVCLVLMFGVLARSGAPSPGSSWPGTVAGATATASTASAAPSVDIAALLLSEPRQAPPIALTDQDARSFTLASLRGSLALVFFGYTHCPDVCPETVGKLGVAMSAFGKGVHAVFVTIDPERDTTAWLKEYSQALPAGFSALTGTAGEIRSTADAWGVRYARVETGDAATYSMSHTADVYLVDGQGRLRADFPYGTDAAAFTAVLRTVAGAATATTAPASTAPPATRAPSALVLDAEVVSSSIWAGQHSPIILALTGPGGRLNDTSAAVSVQLTTAEGDPVGDPVAAVAVKPPGLDDVSWVASLDIPSPRAWRFNVTAQAGAVPLKGTTGLITALDQGVTPPLGGPAPSIHTPTLDDVGGVVRAVTTDPAPDLRLSTNSTTQALADHVPFVLVLDSTKFRVTSACGRALVMAKYLQDRWPDVMFIHHEPFRYAIVTDTPVLEGSLADPVLTDVSSAWGLGSGPWDAVSMPWIFIVDGNGTVRAKYQGVVGSEDVDVIVSLIAQGG